MILVLQFTPRVNYLVSQYVDWILQNEHVKTSTSVHFCLVCKLVRTFWICGRIFLMWPVKWNLCTSSPLVFCCLLSFYNLKSWFWARVDTKYLVSQSVEGRSNRFFSSNPKTTNLWYKTLHHKFIGKDNRFKGRKTISMLQTLARSNLCSLMFYKKI